MKVGKLPARTLGDLLSKITLDDRVIVGPNVGVDAAVIDYGDTLLVAKTDPITFATDEIGWYAVNVNANDIAVMGADPKWFLATMLLPPSASEDSVERIFEQMLDACKALGVSLVGGHTETTYDLEREIVVGCMLGETPRERLVKPGGAKPGHSVILTKGIAIEGTTVLAREVEPRLSEADVPEETLRRARDFIRKPGISVVAEARAIVSAVKPSAMHDPTEGGLATGLWELAAASGVGLEVWADRIPVLPESRVICDALGLDPLGVIASGSLLFTVAPEDEAKALDAVASVGVDAAVIGRIVEQEKGLTILDSAGARALPAFERDEIARIFEA
ncbi:MAG: AIR synthase family protein [Armatimonadota bacterium]|nr:AIR synthase family protein [Armatimonadota bacterium]